MKRPRNGSTVKQVAYARKMFNAQGRNKKEIALSVGYSPALANNANRIEKSEGFLNAMQNLAKESNNLVMAAMLEYKARGFKNFSNKDLNGALNAIAAAWERIGKQRAPNGEKDNEKNPLRKVIMQKVENQTINVTPAQKDEPKEVESIDLDF